MKTFLTTLLLALIAVFNLHAEALLSVPVATLYHDGDVTQFYGSNALQDAHAAAVSGDIITLNSGIFNACTITKGITLRGACMSTTPEMEEQGMRNTIIQNTMHIQVPSTETQTLKFEDLQIYNYLYVDSVPHISFTRVLASQHICTYAAINNFDAAQCSFYSVNSTSNDAATVYSFVNSAIAFTNYSLPYHVNADHCVIGCINASSGAYDGVFKNCIFTYYNGTSTSLPAGCAANYCVAISRSMFSRCTALECKTASMAELFNYNYNTNSYYGCFTNPLTEEASATYLGSDGTQVGIYGGILPFTMMPYNPVVTTCDIAGKTTVDGKLKVQIEVKSVIE